VTLNDLDGISKGVLSSEAAFSDLTLQGSSCKGSNKETANGMRSEIPGRAASKARGFEMPRRCY